MTLNFHKIAAVAALSLTACSANSDDNKDATGSDTAASAPKQDANTAPAEPTIKAVPFVDPAWLMPERGFSEWDKTKLATIAYVGRNNPKVQEQRTYRLFVTALYSCSEAAKSTSSEFDQERIWNEAMARFNAFMATQPAELVHETKGNLYEWDRGSQTFRWSNASLDTFSSGPYSVEMSLNCGGSTLYPFSSSAMERPDVSVDAANEKIVRETMPRIKMDEAAARAFVAANGEREIVLRYSLLSEPQRPDNIFITPGDKFFKPRITKAEVIDKVSGRVLSASTF